MSVYRLIVACLLAVTLLSLKPVSQPSATKRPNIIMLLVDDMGWADLGCYGNEIHETPNIDKLAADGCRYTNAYAACAVCSPSRAAIMTGKFPAQLKITDWIPGVVYPQARLKTAKMRYELPFSELTLPEILKQAGYSTFHVGKWHLGEDPNYWPLGHGFEVNIGGSSKGQPGSYFHPYKNKSGDQDYTVQNLPPGGKDGDYLTDRLTDEAIRLIRDNRASGKPFYLNFWYYVVHTPLEGKPAYVAKYKEKIRQSTHPKYNANYAAMVQSLDESVGKLRQALQQLGLAENTLILLMSDNGGLVDVNGNAPLREGKGFYYEGGIRIPWIMYYPGYTKAGTVRTDAVNHVDVLPTMLDVLKLPQPAGLDGKSIATNAFRGKSLGNRVFYWHYPHYHTPKRPPTGAILVGDYKLLRFYEDNRLELYNVREDVSETKDLAQAEPDRARRLNEQLSKWLAATGAEMPVPNPGYNPAAPFAGSFGAWKGENRLEEKK